MAISQSQKVDFLYKKLGFTKTKTGLSVDGTISGTKKAGFGEQFASPLIIADGSVWNQSELIPTTPPASDTSIVKGYRVATALRMTVDPTVAGNRSYIAYTTFNNTSSARLTNWIDTQFGNDYVVKVYAGDPNSGGTLLPAGGSTGSDSWFFDYSSGVLQFHDTSIHSSIDSNGTNVYIVGYRYIGQTGVISIGDDTNFGDLTVNNNFRVVGLSTFVDAVNLSNNLSVAGITTLAGLSTVTGHTLFTRQLSVSGVSTFNSNVIFPDGVSAKFGTDLDGEIKHTGSNLQIQENTGNIQITNYGNDKDVVINTDDGSGGTANYFKADGSTGETILYNYGNEKIKTTGYGVTVFGTTETQKLNVTGISTFGGAIDANSTSNFGDDVTFQTANTNNIVLDKSNNQMKFGDNVKAKFGGAGDLQLYHNTESIISHSGSGVFKIQGNGSNNTFLRAKDAQNSVTLVPDGEVILHHDGGTRFETTGIGVSVLAGTGNTATIAGPQFLILDPDGVGVNTGVVRIKGDLIVDGEQTIIKSTELEIADFIVGIASTATTDALADGAGFKIGPDNTFLYEHNSGTNPSLKSSENLNVATGKVYQIGETERLSASKLSLGTGTTIHAVGTNILSIGTGDAERIRISDDGINVVGITTIGGSVTFAADGYLTTTTGITIENSQPGIIFSDTNANPDFIIQNRQGSFAIRDITSNANRFFVNAANGDVTVTGGLNVSGISTFAGITTVTGHTLFTKQLSVSGISTFAGLIDANGLIEATAGENKIPSLYNAFSNLPAAGDYHGMFAHVHATQKGYFAHGGAWYELVNRKLDGTVGTGTDSYNVGVITATQADIGNGGLDVDGHTELDNVNISGLTTTASVIVSAGSSITIPEHNDNTALYLGNFTVPSASGSDGARLKQNTTGNTTFEFNNLFNTGRNFYFSAPSNAGNLFYVSDNPTVGVRLYCGGNNLKLQTVGTGITVFGTTETQKLNVTGISTVVGVGTFKEDVYIDKKLYVAGIEIGGPGGPGIGTDITTRHLKVTGIATVTGNTDLNGDLDVDGQTELDDLNVTGVSTFSKSVGITSDLTANSLSLVDNGTAGNVLTIASDDENNFGFVLVNDTYKVNPPAGFKISQYNNGEVEMLLRGNNSTTLGLPYKLRQVSGGSLQRDVLTVNTAGAVGLAYSGNQKLSTSGIGVTVTGQLDTTNIKATGITTTGTLNIGITGHTMVGITTILDEDNMASNSATALATQQSIKAYVDSSSPSGSTLAVSADSGSNESINLASEVLDIEGTSNEIETATGTNKVVIGLPDDVTIGQDLTVTRDLGVTRNLSATGNLTVGAGGTVITTVVGAAASIGIGDASPSYMLDVAGAINSQTDVKVNGVSVTEQALNDAVAMAIALG